MQVKNILVNEKDLFVDLLIKELINEGISFVQVDNEIHFADKIYRFYDKVQILDIFEVFDEKRKMDFFLGEGIEVLPTNIKRVNKNSLIHNGNIFKEQKIENRRTNLVLKKQKMIPHSVSLRRK